MDSELLWFWYFGDLFFWIFIKLISLKLFIYILKFILYVI